MKTRLLVAALLCVALVGAWSTGTAEANSAAGSSKSGLDRALIQFYFRGERKQDTTMVLNAIEDATKDTLNTDIEFTWIPSGDYRNRMTVVAAAGDPYECHFDADWLVWPTLAARGALLDISEIFPQYAPNLYAKFTAKDLAPATVHGELLAVPWLVPKSNRPTFQVREDLRLKYNLPVPKTYDDFELFLKTMKENEPSLIPFMPSYSRRDAWGRHGFVDGWVSLPGNVGFAYQRTDPQMKIVPIEQTSTYAAMVQRRHGWYEAGYMPRDILQAPNEDWTSGKYASTIHIFSWPDSDRMAKSTDPNASVRHYPIHPEAVGQLASPMNNCIAFGANADEPERAMMFLEWVHASQDNYDFLMYGIKGVHYNIVDGVLTYPPGIDPANPPYANWTSRWGFWEQKYQRYPSYYPSNWKQILADYIADNNEYDPHLGFTIDQEPIKTELAQRTSLYEEMGVALEAGVLDPAQLPTYIDRQKANAEVIRVELQRQLDAWRATR